MVLYKKVSFNLDKGLNLQKPFTPKRAFTLFLTTNRRYMITFSPSIDRAKGQLATIINQPTSIS